MRSSHHAHGSIEVRDRSGALPPELPSEGPDIEGLLVVLLQLDCGSGAVVGWAGCARRRVLAGGKARVWPCSQRGSVVVLRMRERRRHHERVACSRPTAVGGRAGCGLSPRLRNGEPASRSNARDHGCSTMGSPVLPAVEILAEVWSFGGLLGRWSGRGCWAGGRKQPHSPDPAAPCAPAGRALIFVKTVSTNRS